MIAQFHDVTLYLLPLQITVIYLNLAITVHFVQFSFLRELIIQCSILIPLKYGTRGTRAFSNRITRLPDRLLRQSG